MKTVKFSLYLQVVLRCREMVASKQVYSPNDHHSHCGGEVGLLDLAIHGLFTFTLCMFIFSVTIFSLYSANAYASCAYEITSI